MRQNKVKTVKTKWCQKIEVAKVVKLEEKLRPWGRRGHHRQLRDDQSSDSCHPVWDKATFIQQQSGNRHKSETKITYTWILRTYVSLFFQPFCGNKRNWIFRNLEFREKNLEFSEKILEFRDKILEFSRKILEFREKLLILGNNFGI